MAVRSKTGLVKDGFMPVNRKNSAGNREEYKIFGNVA